MKAVAGAVLAGAGAVADGLPRINDHRGGGHGELFEAAGGLPAVVGLAVLPLGLFSSEPHVRQPTGNDPEERVRGT
jgi:hypothetical protein